MEPKEQAEKLRNKFWDVEPLANFDGDNGFYSTECALIAVKQLKEECNGVGFFERWQHWNEVEQELLKLIK